MATLQDITRADLIDRVVANRDPSQFVAIPTRPATRKHPNFPSRQIEFQFALDADEFEVMPVDELWSSYVGIMLARMVDTIKGIRLRLKRKLAFHSFDTPVTTMNRVVHVYEKDGVFIVWQAARQGVPRGPTEAQQVINFTFRADIALTDGEEA